MLSYGYTESAETYIEVYVLTLQEILKKFLIGSNTFFTPSIHM
jgi:hypothetical protein